MSDAFKTAMQSDETGAGDALQTAVMDALVLPDATSDGVPEWVHLMPASDNIATYDGRGPYSYTSAQALIDASMARKPKLIIDVNHATDHLAKVGGPAEARGYIIAMQERDDGIWGQIDWTQSGKALLSDRAYWGLSPVFRHDKTGRVHLILSASLTNEPNLRNLTALNQEQDLSPMNWTEYLAKLLGLPDGATDAEIKAALNAKMKGKGDDTAAQSEIAEIGLALGLAVGSDHAAILTAIQSSSTDDDTAKDGIITELQTSLQSMQTQLTTLTTSGANTAAEAFYDAAMAEKRAGVGPASRDYLISMHMDDPAKAEAFVKTMPILDRSGTTIVPPATKEGEVSLQSEQIAVAKMLGQDPKDYAATLAEERNAQEAYQ